MVTQTQNNIYAIFLLYTNVCNYMDAFTLETTNFIKIIYISLSVDVIYLGKILENFLFNSCFNISLLMYITLVI